VISYALVALGSAVGGMARHWCGNLIATSTTGALPWGTLFVNVSGSFLIGILAAVLDGDDRMARELLMVGVLGGYTTFSAFSLQTLDLLRDGKLAQAGANVALSVVCCLVAVWMGYVAARALRA
jgi:CrcB protein